MKCCGCIKDFFTFRCMLTPVLVQMLFWLVVLSMAIGAYQQAFVQHNIPMAIQTIIIGPMFVRVLCELVMIFFRNHEYLKKMAGGK